MINVVEEAKKYALAEIEKYGSPLLPLFEISEKKSSQLAEKLDANKKIVQIGHSLMDIKLGEAISMDKISEHVAMGVKAADDFLTKLKIDKPEKEQILNCIEAHHKAVPFKCIEAEICANADCYRFIHPKGFFIYLFSLGERGVGFQEALEQVEYKLDEKWGILSLDIAIKELEPYYKTLKKFISDIRKD